MNRLSSFLYTSLIVALLVGGCSESKQVTPQPKHPQRIVSLTPHLTEWICELGLSDKLVGINNADTYPPQILDLPKLGNPLLNIESLLSLNSDCIVLDHTLNISHWEQLHHLAKLPLIVVESPTLKTLKEDLARFAQQIGYPEQATILNSQIADKLKEIEQNRVALEPKSAVTLLWGEPLMTSGNNTLLHEALTLIGFNNPYQEIKGYQQISWESLLTKQPDYLIITFNLDERQLQEEPWNRLRAVQKNQIIQPAPDTLVRPTLRTLNQITLIQKELKLTTVPGTQ